MKMPVPIDFDPFTSLSVSAAQHGVSVFTTWGWRKEVGFVFKRNPPIPPPLRRKPRPMPELLPCIVCQKEIIPTVKNPNRKCCSTRCASVLGVNARSPDGSHAWKMKPGTVRVKPIMPHKSLSWMADEA